MTDDGPWLSLDVVRRRHINTGKTDAVIYSVSDTALMQNIGQYYAQGRDKHGKVTELTLQ